MGVGSCNVPFISSSCSGFVRSCYQISYVVSKLDPNSLPHMLIPYPEEASLDSLLLPHRPYPTTTRNVSQPQPFHPKRMLVDQGSILFGLSLLSTV